LNSGFVFKCEWFSESPVFVVDSEVNVKVDYGFLVGSNFTATNRRVENPGFGAPRWSFNSSVGIRHVFGEFAKAAVVIVAELKE